MTQMRTHWGLPAPQSHTFWLLQEAALHWGCIRQNGRYWEPPPPGWHTIPAESKDAGARHCGLSWYLQGRETGAVTNGTGTSSVAILCSVA